MKKTILTLCVLAVTLSSCSSSQFSGVVAGSSLGGLFGSSIGGLVGGPRGHDAGAVIGMVAGGMAGAAATAPRDNSSSSSSSYRSSSSSYDSDDIDYSSYRSTRRPATASRWDCLEVSNIRFSDSNDNRCLDAGERVSIVMDIYNRGSETLYDVAPQVTCDNRRIVISPTAIVSRLEADQGFRYTVEVIAPRNLRSGLATFSVAFGSGKNSHVVKTFRVRTAG